MRNRLILLFTILTFCAKAQNEIIRIKKFGDNPGNLRLNYYKPQNAKTPAPLVVVLHGCTQDADEVARQSGWNKLADQHGFIVLYPEQIFINNMERCFNWFSSRDQKRDKGEPGSVMSMIRYMKNNFSIDTNRIYVTGLSAGGVLTTIMLSVYPEVFDKGAVFAGGPYGAARNVFDAYFAMIGMKAKNQEEWKKCVTKQNPFFKGDYPELAIFHGKKDPVANFNNGRQLAKQWTALHGIDFKKPVLVRKYQGNRDLDLSIYSNSRGEEVVYFFRVKRCGHRLLVDPGACPNQGGKRGLFSKDKNFHSTYWVADFFGLIQKNEKIKMEKINENQTRFTLENASTAKLNWKLPGGEYIAEGQGTISILVNGNPAQVIAEGNDTNGCKMTPVIYQKKKE